ncbi:uncharacterized protein LOC120426211 [Culex pipiens pallens]|uniref:uncharacterized protein LOC120426211 n=1 Tax=Culex pipiens pallens TaxID=42434 RepID=UPI001953CB79|nr:uncharacterized protein LOC120426211 [Culex pipiens pallens]
MAASTSWYPSAVGNFGGDVDSPEPELLQSHGGRMQVVSASQRFCRLCLSKEQQLKPIFPPDGTPDESLLQRILSCLTITISFDDDYDTFICRICSQEVTKFFLYKEQCLANDSIIRNRRKPSKGMFYDEEGSNGLGVSIPQNGNGGGDVVELSDDSDVEQGGPNWEEEGQGDPIDSDEFDIREEESGDTARDAEEFNDADSDKGEVGSLLKPLPRMRARRDNVQDFYHGGFRYTCATSRANGKIHWRCMYKSKLKCRAAILVASNGSVSRGPNRHNHKPEAKTNQKTSEGVILDTHTGRKVHYRLITSERSGVHPVQVVCNGYKYRYARTTQKKTTYWRCMKHNGKENCKAVVSFRLDFSSCSSNGNSHNHPAQYDMQQLQDEEEEQVAEPEVMPTFGILKPGKKLAHAIRSNGSSSSGDGFGKTQISLKGSGRWNVMIHKGYEFGFPRADKKNNKWACYKKSLFNCPANVTTNETGRVIKESDWAHNHRPSDDYAKTDIIEGQMQDVRNEGQPVYYKLIPGKRGQRFVLYKGYRYSSDRLISDGRIAWKCTKCKVFVMIGGRFATFEERGDEHEHPVLEEDDESMPYDASLVDALMAVEGGEEEGDEGADEDGSQDVVVKEEQSLVDEDSQEADGDGDGEDDEEDEGEEDELIIPEVMVE